MKKSIVFVLIILFLLAGCKTVVEEAPVEIPVYFINYSPAVKPVLPAIYTCAAEFPNAIFSPKENYYQGDGLNIQLGEPEVLPENIVPLAYDDIMLVTHSTNPITEWTDFRIINLINGRIDDWDYLGWTGEVEVWFPAEEDEIYSLIDLHILDGNPVGITVSMTSDLQEIYNAVSNNPGAISFLPASILDNKLSLNAIGLRLPVLVLYTSEIDQTQQDFLICLQGETGQTELSKSYEVLP